ncbi:MAG TPA: Uma2 family endonuclease [Nitrospirae bacterium]|nr:Uma2 family endonuclease [Nitrospirota bacterium]HDZ01436.1 Uma2 family endonuclease [Nitrospirota bacterium]
MIEILSDWTIQKYRIVKMKIYAKYGIKHLWLIDPENQTIESFELDRKKLAALCQALQGRMNSNLPCSRILTSLSKRSGDKGRHFSDHSL